MTRATCAFFAAAVLFAEFRHMPQQTVDVLALMFVGKGDVAKEVEITTQLDATLQVIEYTNRVAAVSVALFDDHVYTVSLAVRERNVDQTSQTGAEAQAILTI